MYTKVLFLCILCTCVHTVLYMLAGVCTVCMRQCWWAAYSTFEARESVHPLT